MRNFVAKYAKRAGAGRHDLQGKKAKRAKQLQQFKKELKREHIY